MTSENERTAETNATTAGEVYRQARDQVAAQSNYDIQSGLDRLTHWMQDTGRHGLRVVPECQVEEPRVVEEPRMTVRYPGVTASTVAGITNRQLHYFARTGLVEPSFPAKDSDSAGLYSFLDILILKVVKQLQDCGISLQQIRAVVSHLRDRQVHDLAQITLISDGQSIAECTSPDEVVDAIQGAQGVFGIALGLVWQEVEGGLAELHGNPYLYEEISYASEEIPNEAIR